MNTFTKWIAFSTLFSFLFLASTALATMQAPPITIEHYQFSVPWMDFEDDPEGDEVEFCTDSDEDGECDEDQEDLEDE